MLNLIKRCVPIKAKSLDEFISIAEKEGSDLIEAKLVTKLKSFSAYTVESGFIGNFEYGAKFKTSTKSKRPVILKEIYMIRFGSERGKIDENERDFYDLRLYATVHKMVEKIEEKLPALSEKMAIHLIDNLTFSERMLNLFRYCKNNDKFDITPF